MNVLVIIVLLLGLGPLIFVMFSQGRQQNTNRTTNNNNTNQIETQKTKKTKKHHFSGWKIVIFLSDDILMSWTEKSIDFLKNVLIDECDVYLVTRIPDFKTREKLLNVCQLKGIVEQSANVNEVVIPTTTEKSLNKRFLNPFKVLCCSTKKGVVAIGRQIEPELFIDCCQEKLEGPNDVKIADELTRFLSRVEVFEEKEEHNLEKLLEEQK